MKKMVIILEAILVLFFIACSKSNEQNILPPEVNYNGEILATFFTEGKSNAPDVNWNGDEGRFGLEAAVNGISVDPETGIISWDSRLPIGITEINLIAFNNSGGSNVTVNLNNRPKGIFKGEHNPTIYLVFNTDFEILFDFKLDGSFTGYTQSKNPDCTLTNPSNFEGHYDVINGQIQAQFKYSPSSNFTNYLFGDIHYASTGAKFEGRYDVQPEKDDYFSEFNTAFVPAN